MSLVEPIAVTLELVSGLEELGLDYVVGGSVASSLHGIPRATQDIDIVVVLWGKDVDGFVKRFESSFYVDRDMVMDAIKRRASFNIIHLATMYKVDVFVADRSGLVREELSRRLAVELGEPPRTVWVCLAEDIVLQKLDWYEQAATLDQRRSWTRGEVRSATAGRAPRACPWCHSGTQLACRRPVRGRFAVRLRAERGLREGQRVLVRFRPGCLGS